MSYLFKKSFTGHAWFISCGFLLVLGLFVLWFFTPRGLSQTVLNREPNNLTLSQGNIPIGTPLVIPPWIMEQYHLGGYEALYGDPLNFLLFNYGVAARDAEDEKKDTYYVPLSRYKSSSFDYSDRGYRGSSRSSKSTTKSPPAKPDKDSTFMVDVTKIKIKTPAKPSPTVKDSAPSTPKPATTGDTPAKDSQTQGGEASPPAKGGSAPAKDSQTQGGGASPSVTEGGSSVAKPSNQEALGDSKAKGDLSKTGGSTPSSADKEAGANRDLVVTPKDPAESQSDSQPLGASSSNAEGATNEQPKPADTLKQEEAGSTQTQSPIFGTTDIIDKDKENIPSVPDLKLPEELAQNQKPQIVQATCDQADVTTEAGSTCVDCIHKQMADKLGNTQGAITDFLAKVDSKTEHFSKGKDFKNEVKTLCKQCNDINVGDFFSYMEQRAEATNVPKEVLFAIMMKESSGRCNVLGDDDGSYGLFQLNTKNSTKLRGCRKGELDGKSNSQMKEACTKGNYRKHNNYKKVNYKKTAFAKRPNIGPMICLQNPYCNFEEALHLLKDEKWKSIGNKRADGSYPNRPKGKKSWVDLSLEERNLWRNAIIAYNGDQFHAPAKKAMKKALGTSANFDDWELKRMFFIKQYLSSPSSKRQNLIGNLAYVERITGREIKGDFANSSICQWARFRKENPNPTCP